MLNSWFKRYKYGNTRRYLRLPASWPVKLEPNCSTEKKTLSQTRDVSAGGIALQSRTQMPVGSRVCLEVYLPPLSRSIPAEGRVVRCTPLEENGFELGIRFDRILPEDQKALDEAVGQFASHRDRALQKKGSWRKLP